MLGGGGGRGDRKQRRRKLAKHVSACARVAGFFFCVVILKDTELGRKSIVGTRPFSHCSVPRAALLCGPQLLTAVCLRAGVNTGSPSVGSIGLSGWMWACGACGVVGGGV